MKNQRPHGGHDELQTSSSLGIGLWFPSVVATRYPSAMSTLLDGTRRIPLTIDATTESLQFFVAVLTRLAVRASFLTAMKTGQRCRLVPRPQQRIQAHATTPTTDQHDCRPNYQSRKQPSEIAEIVHPQHGLRLSTRSQRRSVILRRAVYLRRF